MRRQLHNQTGPNYSMQSLPPFRAYASLACTARAGPHPRPGLLGRLLSARKAEEPSLLLGMGEGVEERGGVVVIKARARMK